MRVWVSGCCGYVGSLLVPYLLCDKHQVVGLDLKWFGGGYLPGDNGSLRLISGDMRDEDVLQWSLEDCDVAIHLAGLTSDKSCQIDLELHQSVNVDALQKVMRTAKEAGVKQFIYLSSAAIFGGETLYSRAKRECEDIVLYHESRDFPCIILRPASVCGYAPRMRFDLPVNRMTRDAMMMREIHVNGGSQVRTNVHIRDLCDTLRKMVGERKSAILNLCASNLTMLETAAKVQMLTGARIVTHDYTDARSYEMTSDLPTTYPIEDAIRDMVVRFKSGYWKDAMTNPVYMNVLQEVEAAA